MAQPIIMPKLGQMTEESRVVRWLKKEGEAVAKGEPLLEIETDKATMEVESFYDGVVLKILVEEGETVPVMQTLAYVGEPGETVDPNQAPALDALAAVESGDDVERPPDVDTPAAAAELNAEPAEPVRVKISPRAAGLALARGLEGRQIHGSGPGGRIIERDVLAALKEPAFERTPSVVRERGFEPEPTRPAGPETGKPLSRMRLIISQRLTQSFTSTPHFYVTVSADMTAIERARSELKARSEQLSVTDFLVKASALALVDFPDCNSWTDGKCVRRHSGIDIGLAVALEDGLMVPVIRDADRLSLREIAAITKGLAEKAKRGKLKPEEMAGSSFTISNMGMLQVENFTAIINPGESAILAVGTATPQPVVVAGSIEVRPMMKMTLSADHRLIDGALAARFLNRIKERLEEFWSMIFA